MIAELSVVLNKGSWYRTNLFSLDARKILKIHAKAQKTSTPEQPIMCFESRYRGESTENRVGIEFAVAGTKHVDFYVFPPKVVVASPPRLKKRLHVADGTKATGATDFDG